MLLGVPLGIILGYVTTAVIVSYIDVTSFICSLYLSGDGLFTFRQLV